MNWRNNNANRDPLALPSIEQKPVFGFCLLPKNLVERLQKQKITGMCGLPSISALTSANPKVMALSRIGDFLETCRDVQVKFGAKGLDQKVLLSYLYNEDIDKREQQIEKALRKLLSGGLQTYSSHVKYPYSALQYVILLPGLSELMSALKALAEVLKVSDYDLIIETARSIKQNSFDNFPL